MSLGHASVHPWGVSTCAGFADKSLSDVIGDICISYLNVEYSLVDSIYHDVYTSTGDTIQDVTIIHRILYIQV